MGDAAGHSGRLGRRRGPPSLKVGGPFHTASPEPQATPPGKTGGAAPGCGAPPRLTVKKLMGLRWGRYSSPSRPRFLALRGGSKSVHRSQAEGYERISRGHFSGPRKPGRHKSRPGGSTSSSIRLLLRSSPWVRRASPLPMPLPSAMTCTTLGQGGGEDTAHGFERGETACRPEGKGEPAGTAAAALRLQGAAVHGPGPGHRESRGPVPGASPPNR